MKKIYPPSDDTYLLIECIEPFGEVLEIGCGSGLVSLEAFKKGAKKVYCGDVNPYAVIETKKLLKKYNVQCVVKISNMFNSFKDKKFDVIIFNPPYVPSEDGEDNFSYMELAWNGGPDGRRFIDRFLDEFDNYLKDNGVAYLIHPDYCDLEKTRKKLNKKGYTFEIVGKKKLFFETLYCLKIFKLKNN